MEDLKRFEEKNKKSLFETLGTQLRVGLEDLMNVIGFGQKKTSDKLDKLISVEFDKYENKIINRKKH